MKKLTKLFLVPIGLFISLLFFGVFSYAGPVGILEFEPDDTLEELREKIRHNGYNFTVDHNWVYDMPSEMKRKFFGRHPSLLPRKPGLSERIGPLTRHLGKELPAAFDWRDHNGRAYIGPIRDQGSCGSCYAFAACAAAEGTYNWAHGRYDDNCADFSEAYVAFCLSDYYSGFDGCSGANYDYEELDALVEVGVCDEDTYHYEDHEQECPWASPPPPPETTSFDAWHRIPCDDIEAIKTGIMTYGVVDAAVYVGSAFQAYSGGIYEDSRVSCSSSPCYYTPTNHAIALVGWNDNGDPDNQGYWILRNSWGPSWGEDGYMRIKYRSARVACEGTYFILEQVPVCEEDDSGAIDIEGKRQKSGSVSFPVRIQSAPNAVTAIGFEVTYPSVLTYTGYAVGALAEGFTFFDCSEPEQGVVRCGGFDSGSGISAGASGEVVNLIFDIAEGCEGTHELTLQELKDNIAQWSWSHGCFDCSGCSCDINGDDEVTPMDALCAFQMYLGICPTECGPCEDICCDVTMDDDCTPQDALEIFKEYLGLPSVCSE